MEKRLFELIMTLSAKCWATEQKIMDQLSLSPAEFDGLLILKDGEALPGFELSAKIGAIAIAGKPGNRPASLAGICRCRSRPRLRTDGG